MAITWIVAADDKRARIFETQRGHGHLLSVEDFANPGAHYGPPEAVVPDQDIDRFCGDVRAFLDQARVDGRFDRLCLIGYPKFLGRLRQDLGKELNSLVEDEMPKDLSGMDAHAIEDYVRTLH